MENHELGPREDDPGYWDGIQPQSPCPGCGELEDCQCPTVEELKAIISRCLNYHDGAARCESAEAIQQCACAVCYTARPIIEAKK